MSVADLAAMWGPSVWVVVAEFLESSSLVPGRNGTVTAASPDGTTTVEIDGKYVGIGQFASTRILVTV